MIEATRSSRIKLAIVGLGKIAGDQHVPALRNSEAFELIAVASPNEKLDGVENFPNLDALLRNRTDVEAVSLCTPPQVRFEAAWEALQRGCHVLLEKPPGVTVSEVLALIGLARTKRRALLASWHSRFADGVAAAKAWVAATTPRSVKITWKEDVRVWHPGQQWIWTPGGLGVFDPGINALSILTHVMPQTVRVQQAELSFPRNCHTPIAASLRLQSACGCKVAVELDFLQTGPQTWDIEIEADAGLLLLSKGGSELSIDGKPVRIPRGAEYPDLYAHFAALISERRIDADIAPLQLVADAFLVGRRTDVAEFNG
jgi:D-galactose 1-dehydrogenase